MAKNKFPVGSFQITDGPNKFDLMNSVFDAKHVQITCDILPTGINSTMKFSPKVAVHFRFIGPEDGSNETWLGTINVVDPNYESEMRQFYYSSKTRKGVVHERVIAPATKPDVWDVFKKM